MTIFNYSSVFLKLSFHEGVLIFVKFCIFSFVCNDNCYEVRLEWISINKHLIDHWWFCVDTFQTLWSNIFTFYCFRSVQVDPDFGEFKSDKEDLTVKYRGSHFEQFPWASLKICFFLSIILSCPFSVQQPISPVWSQPSESIASAVFSGSL